MSAFTERQIEPERILERAQKRVDDQIVAIEELKAGGQNTVLAERLLETYRDVLAALAG